VTGAIVLIVLLAPSSSSASDIYVSASVDEQGVLHIVVEGGREILRRKEADQVGFGKPRISADGRAVGWLADFPNCCTSYPIPLKLVVYSNGHTRTFTGSGLPISRWAFQADGKRVAFEQETVHGGLGVHYELRDVSSGRMMAAYEPRIGPDNQPVPNQQPPDWVKQLDSTPEAP
jgi:hypothetical protein